MRISRIALGLLVAGLAGEAHAQAQTANAPSGMTGTIIPVTVTGSSAQVLAAGRRQLLAIVNESTTDSIACNFGGTAALNTAGNFTSPPGTTRTWLNYPIPGEAINCISSGMSTPVTIEVH